jgi:hypothetical protein
VTVLLPLQPTVPIFGGGLAVMLTLVPSVHDQDSVELCPDLIELGLAEILTVGLGGGFTLTVTESLAGP